MATHVMVMAASAAAAAAATSANVDEYGIPLVEEEEERKQRKSASLVRRVVGALSRGGASARGNKKGKQNVDSDDSDDDDASTMPKPTPTKTTTPATTTKPKWWHAKTWTFTAQDDEALRRTSSTLSTLGGLDAFARAERAASHDDSFDDDAANQSQVMTRFADGVPAAPSTSTRTLADMGTSTTSALFELETVGEDAESLRDFCRNGDRAREALVERLVSARDTDAAIAVRFCTAVGEMEHMMGGVRAVRASKIAAKYADVSAPMHVVGVDVACPPVPPASASIATKEASKKAGLVAAEALRSARDEVLRTLARNEVVMDFVRNHDARMARRMSGV